MLLGYMICYVRASPDCYLCFFFSSRRRHTRCALVTGVQTCALPISRLENMIGLAGYNLPAKAVRTQIASAIDMIVQVSRMRDGMRRITHIEEIVGMEGDIITSQTLFSYEFQGEGKDGLLLGSFKSSGLRPHFAPNAAYFSLDKPLLEAMG